ncbi:MAG: hypothetical protein CL868_17215 [Cytophagaceae bacterium]|nr:hypothetical protein [Cytophagaceae bacterium]|tara:strand:+ start:1591 stop:2301 length:711 start_codon:yes stop_codon:yes gene_type:complete
MKTILHKAESRGEANFGWLHSRHSFSFGNYYDSQRMNFGALRVINDDRVKGGEGFGTHPHRDMEIISIPLTGTLEHKDSMGNSGVIKQGDIQVMSAGTGIHHSEYNHNKDEEVKFLQIWVTPNRKGVTPRYDQVTLKVDDRKNALQQVLSPKSNDDGVWIHQDAWFYMSNLDAGKSLDYELKTETNGVYIFVITGQIEIEGQEINTRDGYGISGTKTFSLTAKENSELLLMEVPMH